MLTNMNNSLVYLGIMLILMTSILGALLVFFRTMKQQRRLHKTILRSQNEKEIETYSRIAGEYLHQQVINGRILPHLIQLKELNQLVEANKTQKNQVIADKIQQLMQELKQTENIIRNISEHIFPPHLMYFFVETCQKRLNDLQEHYHEKAKIIFHHQGNFNDLTQLPTLLYNVYSLIDLFVTNSLQNAQADTIQVTLTREATQLTLDMRDDGIGFNIRATELTTTGRGLADFKGRAIILSPDYVFDSIEKKGTHFKILIDIQKIKG
jgi:signal transduction histidine kinase